MKEKFLSAFIVVILLLGLGVCAVRADDASITVIKDTVSSDRMTVTLNNVSYEHGWFMGTVVFEDEFFSEYALSHQDIDVIMNYFSDYYTLTYMESGMSEVLPTPGGGCVLDDGAGYYYEKFKKYIELENETRYVQIYVYGIEEPFEIELRD